MNTHAGELLKDWRQAQGLSAARLARMLPEPLADGQMVYRYEKAERWIGSTANGLWLVEQGAFPREILEAPRAEAQGHGGQAA